MSSSYDAKDYRLTHFEHKSLTKIHDRPDIDSLVQIFKELKRNAQKLPTSLGGGLLGYFSPHGGAGDCVFAALGNTRMRGSQFELLFVSNCWRFMLKNCFTSSACRTHCSQHAANIF